MPQPTLTLADIGLTGDAVNISIKTEDVTVGVAVQQGNILYKNTGSSQYGLADITSDTTDGSANGSGLRWSLGKTVANGRVNTAKPGMIVDSGGTVTKGLSYWLDVNGTWVPFADLTAADRLVCVGVAISTSHLYLVLQAMPGYTA